MTGMAGEPVGSVGTPTDEVVAVADADAVMAVEDVAEVDDVDVASCLA